MQSAATIKRRIEALQAEYEAAVARARADVVSRIRGEMAVYGITAEELAAGATEPPAAPLKRGRPVKYRDRSGNTWGGGGSIPKWLQAHVEAGKDIESFRVKK